MKIFMLFLIICFCSFSQYQNDLELAAKLRFEKKNYEALEIYNQILRSDSNQLVALLAVSDLYTILGFSEKQEDKKKLMFQWAIQSAEKSFTLKPDSDAVHLALARAYGRMAQILSIKEQLIMSKKVKYSAEKAAELNPNNDIAWHIIGKWHFRISELSWFEKTMANVIFGGIPKDASFEVAKYSFEKALTIKPNSIAHHVELAKTLIELDQEDKAKLLLEKTLTLDASESNDPEYLEEAKKILKKL